MRATLAHHGSGEYTADLDEGLAELAGRLSVQAGLITALPFHGGQLALSRPLHSYRTQQRRGL